MRVYELVLVVKPLADAKRKEAIEAVKTLLGKTIKEEKEWGSKLLKYKIKKEITGYYYDFVFEAETLPTDLNSKLLRNANVLRHLVIRKK